MFDGIGPFLRFDIIVFSKKKLNPDLFKTHA